VGGVEIRGLLAFGAVVVAIALLWVRIDSHDAAKAVGLGATTTTISIATSSTSTTTPDQAIEMVCDAADSLMAGLAALEAQQPTEEEEEEEVEADVGAAIRLTARFWTDVLPALPSEVRTEAAAVVDYYEGYLDVAEPFDHDPARIIAEGDKERYEQLLTRPVPGLDTSRGFVTSVCGVEVPDKPSMSEESFADLEDRLIDSDPLGR
jgi:hypothetical protein